MTWALVADENHEVIEADESNYYLYAAKHAIKARLTQVATAVKHAFLGSKQIFRVPNFLRSAEQSQDLMLRSAITNVVFYLIPAMLLSYLNPAERQLDFNNYSDYVEFAAFAMVYNYALVRLLFSRKEINIGYVIASSRVVKNDIEKILPHSLAEGLATELTTIFNHQINASKEPNFIHDYLFSDLYTSLDKFFKKSTFTVQSFGELQTTLSALLQKVLNEYYSIQSSEFSNGLAQEFINILSSDFLPADTIANTAKEDKLVLALFHLKEENDLEEAEHDAADIRKRLLQIKTNVQHFLPIVYYPACKCSDYNSLDDIRKVNVANISSIPYYLGHLLFTFIPELWESASKIPLEVHVGVLLLTLLASNALYFSDVISKKTFLGMQSVSLLALTTAYIGSFIPPNVFYAMQWGGFFARSLLTGLNFVEIAVTQEQQCTSARNVEMNRNKAYAFGLGHTQTVISESTARLLHYFTGVRNVCTNNAIDEMLTLINTIGTLAFKKKLPGMGKNTWNLFFLSRAATRALLEIMNKLLQQRPQLPEMMISGLKSLGQTLGFLAWIFLGPHHYPSRPPKNIKQELQSYLLQHQTILYLLQIYRRDIENILSYQSSAQALAWLARPVSWIAPSIFVPFLYLAANALTNDALFELLEKIKLALEEIGFKESNKVKVIEDEAELSVAPALLPEETKRMDDDFELVHPGIPSVDFSKTPLQRFALLGNRLLATVVPNSHQLQNPTQTTDQIITHDHACRLK